MDLSKFQETLIGQIPPDLHKQIGTYFVAFDFQTKTRKNHWKCWIEYTDFCDICGSTKDTLLGTPNVCHRRCASCVYNDRHNKCERCENYYNGIRQWLINELQKTLSLKEYLYGMKSYNQYAPCYICYSNHSDNECALCTRKKSELLKIEHNTPCGKITRYACDDCCFAYKKEFHCTLTTIVD